MLIELANFRDDAGAKSEVDSTVRNEIGDVGFLVSMVILHNQLFAVNFVGKTLQKRRYAY